jgi:hypothetical protein
VHYVEDVLLGWALGLLFGLLAIRYTERLAHRWREVPYGFQIAIAVVGCAALWLLAFAFNNWQIDSQFREVTLCGGWLTGIVIACPLELRIVNFDPRSGRLAAKLIRYLLSIGIMLAVSLVLNAAFAQLASYASLVGSALDYLRLAAASFAGMFLAPFIFSKLKLAAAKPDP